MKEKSNINPYHPFTIDQITEEYEHINNLPKKNLDEIIHRLGRSIEYRLAPNKEKAFEALAFWSLWEQREEEESQKYFRAYG